MRTREIESVEELEHAAIRAHGHGGSMRGWQVQGLDLRGADDVLRRLDPSGALFLGCRFADGTEDLLRAGGALVFPTVPDVPFDPWRGSLYTTEELYAGLDHGYEHTADARIYAWSRKHATSTALHDSLATALHDNSIDDALAEYVRERRVVGVMGGHATGRDEPAYRDAARLGHALAAHGLTVATGGGPGAMEAANLGAALADVDGVTLDAAITRAAAVPTFTPSVRAWAQTAFDAVAGLPRSGRSLGVPTWFYGHEPPNPFTVAIAKYFRNAIREDVLLHLSRAGIVFLPGAAGTVQEIFQAACENYYAAPDLVAPMILVGRDHWTRTLPAQPLLAALGDGRALGAHVHLVDHPDEAVALLLQELSPHG